MKKFMLVAAVAMVFGMVGCSKKHDCKCTIETTMMGETTTSTVDYKDVEEDCDKMPTTDAQMPGMTMKQTCEEV